MIQANSLLQFQTVKHGFSEIADGNMDYRFGPQVEVLNHRQRLLEKLGLALEDTVQQRGLEDGIHMVTAADKSIGMYEANSAIKANAFITDKPGIGLFLCIADCLPIILYDPSRHVIALLHAARNSTSLKLGSQVMDRLVNTFQCRPSDIRVVFGPTIKASSYIFEEDIITRLVGTEWQPYFTKTGDGRVMVDVSAYNKQQFLAAGVLAEHLEDLVIDTFTSSNFFSHVRSVKQSQPEGRFAAVVTLTQ